MRHGSSCLYLFQYIVHHSLIHSLFNKSFTSTFSKSEIRIKVSKSGWQVLVHHLEMVAWSLPNISANHLFERLVTANIIFNLFTSFFAMHYYKISKYACKSTKIISEKGTIFSKCLRDMHIIEYFAILFLSLIIIKNERKRSFWSFSSYY